MDIPGNGPINAIEHIPGLYISEITIPQSSGSLNQHGITHVLSLTSTRDCPKIDGDGYGKNIRHLHVDIEDNPMEDLLMCLDGLCAWIATALHPQESEEETAIHENRPGEEEYIGKIRPPSSKVLVHCIQGISRSGAVIVAYLMRTSLSYDEALYVARQYRGSIIPNSGFAEQLRVWKELDCSIYTPTRAGSEDEVNLKKEYEDWKDNRGVLLTKVEKERQQIRMDKMRKLIL